jgi:hypothetical protein
MVFCYKCNLARKKNQLTISCNKCNSICHKRCSSITAYTEFHRIKNQNTWICEICATKESPICKICEKTDRRKIIIICPSCKITFPRSCHIKTYPNNDKNLEEWLCKPCSDSSKTTTTPLEELSSTL